jgi:hypothetical protein
MLDIKKNPILDIEVSPAADIANFTSPSSIRRPAADHRRELKDMRRAQSAREAIGTLDKTTSIYGLSKSAFSFLDMLRHVLEQTGPADVAVSTWTAAGTHIKVITDFAESGLIRSSRWLVDFSFTKRTPGLAQALRKTFGDDCIRVCPNHSKFALVGTDEWRVVIRTSANMNTNPRFEVYEVGHDPPLYDFHATILDELWQKQKRTDADTLRPYELIQAFKRDF